MRDTSLWYPTGLVISETKYLQEKKKKKLDQKGQLDTNDREYGDVCRTNRLQTRSRQNDKYIELKHLLVKLTFTLKCLFTPKKSVILYQQVLTKFSSLWEGNMNKS